MAFFQSLFSIDISRNLYIKQIDVVTAFLYGLFDEIISVEQLHEFLKSIPVYQLKQALYGLKHAPRVWYLVICNFLKDKNFIVTDFDQSMFISINKHLFLAIYVNNLFLFGTNKT